MQRFPVLERVGEDRDRSLFMRYHIEREERAYIRSDARWNPRAVRIEYRFEISAYRKWQWPDILSSKGYQRVIEAFLLVEHRIEGRNVIHPLVAPVRSMQMR